MVSSLGVSTREDWVPVYSRLCFVGRHFFFLAVGFLLILKFFRVVLLVHEVSRCHFPFWRFRWVYLSLNFLHKLKLWLQNIPIDRRKPITFVTYFGCLVSNLGLFFRYFFKCFITEYRFVTGAGWLYSQAICHRLRPLDLVQVVPAYIKCVIVLSQANIYLSAWIYQRGLHKSLIVSDSQVTVIRVATDTIRFCYFICTRYRRSCI